MTDSPLADLISRSSDLAENAYILADRYQDAEDAVRWSTLSLVSAINGLTLATQAVAIAQLPGSAADLAWRANLRRLDED